MVSSTNDVIKAMSKAEEDIQEGNTISHDEVEKLFK